MATVDAGGVVTGIGPGTAGIKASAEGASGTTTVTVVKSSLRSLPIEPRSTTARTGDVVHLTAKGTPSADFTPQWSVSGSGATIYSDGAFVAEQPGTYIVNASSGNVTTTASVVVAPRNVERELRVVGRALFKEFQGAEEWIIGNYAYYSTISDRFLVYDISDPAHPKLTDTVKVDARLVAATTTWAGVRPASTMSSISQCSKYPGNRPGGPVSVPKPYFTPPSASAFKFFFAVSKKSR